MSTHLEKALTELHSARPVMWLQNLDSLHMIRVEQLFMENDLATPSTTDILRTLVPGFSSMCSNTRCSKSGVRVVRGAKDPVSESRWNRVLNILTDGLRRCGYLAAYKLRAHLLGRSRTSYLPSPVLNTRSPLGAVKRSTRTQIQ
ncbi:hypothetical protein C0J52_02663 [Blattella germanica]|nr:hypothetical protein C0J52_02663 [Blattella germanica]